MVKKRKSLKKSAAIKKTLKDFMADEDGFVSKETILKVGLATVAGVGMLGALSGAAAKTTHTSHASHNNTVTYPTSSNMAECPAYVQDHSNVPGHSNHESY